MKNEKMELLEKENLEYKKKFLLLLENKKEKYDKIYKIVKYIFIILYIISCGAALILLPIQLYFKNSFNRKIKKYGFKKLDDFYIVVNKIKNNEEFDSLLLSGVPNSLDYSKKVKYIVNNEKSELDNIIQQEIEEQEKSKELERQEREKAKELEKQEREKAKELERQEREKAKELELQKLIQSFNNVEKDNIAEENISYKNNSNNKVKTENTNLIKSIIIATISGFIFLIIFNLWTGHTKIDDHVISCAKSALIDYAKYTPSIGSTKILEKDKYGRYLVECCAELKNAFGTGKYDYYYIIIYNVHKDDNGEWFYNYNRANGILSVGTFGTNESTIDSVKKLNNWNEPIDTK